MPSVSRRSFLKKTLFAGAAAGTAGVSLPASAKGKSPGELATLLDIRKCIGCEACVDACQDTNGHKYPEPVKPFPKMYPKRVKVADFSDKRDIRDRLTPYNWLFIQYADVEVDGESQVISFPRRCMHCQNPPCADLCPWGAARKLKNGITRIDADICLGGMKCKKVCPWQIPERQTGVGLYLDLLPSLAGNGVMYKCDRCYDRIEEGLLPACIEACPEEVQTIGPRDEIIRKAHAIADEIGGYIYGEKENGGTNTIYVSPVPFEELNKGITTGPGRPHLAEVEDKMASAENMTKAVMLAPVAGAAAAMLKFYNAVKAPDTKEDTKNEA